MVLCRAIAGMAIVMPTYDGGLCALMLLCIAGASMAMIRPIYDGGLLSMVSFLVEK